MISNILLALTGFIINTISVLGYPGIVLLMAMHSAAIPVPSEVIMPFAGFLVSTGRFNFWGVAIAGTLGNLLGGSVIYFIALKGGRSLIEKYEHKVFISNAELVKVEKFFNRFGSVAIFFGRCIPIVATFISIPAGLAKVKYWKFAVFTFLGAVIWNIALTYVGYKLGVDWSSLRNKFHNAETLIAIVVFGLIVFWIWRHLKQRTKV